RRRGHGYFLRERRQADGTYAHLAANGYSGKHRQPRHFALAAQRPDYLPRLAPQPVAPQRRGARRAGQRPAGRRRAAARARKRGVLDQHAALRGRRREHHPALPGRLSLCNNPGPAGRMDRSGYGGLHQRRPAGGTLCLAADQRTDRRTHPDRCRRRPRSRETRHHAHARKPRISETIDRMRRLLFIALLTCLAVPVFGQGRIAGTVTDADTGETLIGVNLIVQGTSRGAATDFDGNYIIENLRAGEYNILVSYIGFESKLF